MFSLLCRLLIFKICVWVLRQHTVIGAPSEIMLSGFSLPGIIITHSQLNATQYLSSQFFCEMKFSASIATNKQKYLEIFKEKNAHACL